jgi:putative endonuclease
MCVIAAHHSPMTATRQRLGAWAEELAAGRLEAGGWRILARNHRTRYGEIDIVGSEGHVLVFVEVKSGRLGSAAGPERPVLAVGREKQRRIRRLAGAFLAERRPLPRFAEIRFDVIGVTVDREGGLARYEHLRGAF